MTLLFFFFLQKFYSFHLWSLESLSFCSSCVWWRFSWTHEVRRRFSFGLCRLALFWSLPLTLSSIHTEPKVRLRSKLKVFWDLFWVFILPQTCAWLFKFPHKYGYFFIVPVSQRNLLQVSPLRLKQSILCLNCNVLPQGSANCPFTFAMFSNNTRCFSVLSEFQVRENRNKHLQPVPQSG